MSPLRTVARFTPPSPPAAMVGAAVLTCLLLPLPVTAQDDEIEKPAALPVEAIEAPKPDPDAEAGEAPEPFKLSARVSSISIDRRLTFHADGRVNHRSNRLSISIYCGIEGEPHPSTYQLVHMDPIVTSGGQVLQPDMNDRLRMLNRHRHGNAKAFSLSVRVGDFGLAKGKIKQIAGTVRFQLPTGEKLRARLAPFKKFSNQKTALERFDHDWVHVRREGNRTHVRMNPDLFNRVIAVKFIDADGKEIKANGFSLSWNQERVERRYRAALPEDAAVVIDFHEKLIERNQPFVIKDVPLPAKENGDVFDMADAAQAERVPG